MDSGTAMAILNGLRVSPRKLNLIAQAIRGMKADKAINYLSFCQRRVAKDVKKTVLSAIANAENNHGLDIDKLYIHEAYVGHGIRLKRFHARAKGRGASIKKVFSNLSVKVIEKEV
ncbi:MAG: 50S ribosomal protein L22 [Alphaproteobacteria bacterium]|nr:50S ribosomal protein L22 [Alphaproteobacteria bacterium]